MDDWLDGYYENKAILEGTLNVTGDAVMSSSSITAFDSTGFSDGDAIFFSGRDTPNDGGGGWFTFSADSIATADDVVTFAPAGGGRLFRDGYTIFGFSKALDPRFGGAKVDGVTDDTVAMQRVIDYAESLINLLFARGVDINVRGDYLINGTLTITAHNINFIGNRASFKRTVGGTMFVIGDPTHATNTYGVSFFGITFYETAVSSIDSLAIKFHNCVNGRLEACWFQNWYQSIEGNRLYGYVFDTVWFLGTNRFIAANPTASVNGDCHVILQDDPINHTTSGSNKFTDCEFWGLGQDILVGGIFYGYAASVRIVCSDTAWFNGCHFYQAVTDLEIVPDGLVGRNRVMDIMCNNCYFDYANTQNVLIGGAMPSEVTVPAGVYKNIRFNQCFFRDSVNGIVVDITESVTPPVTQFKTLQVLGGGIETQANRAILVSGGAVAPTNHSIQGLMVKGVTIGGTNESNAMDSVIYAECDDAIITGNEFLAAANPVLYGILVDSRSEAAAINPDVFNLANNNFTRLNYTSDHTRYSASMSNVIQSGNQSLGYGATIKDTYKRTTTDATIRTIFSKFVQERGAGILKFKVIGVDDTGAKYQIFSGYQAFTRSGGALALIGTLTTEYSNTVTLTTLPTVTVGSGFISINITGVAATNVDWVCDADLLLTGH